MSELSGVNVITDDSVPEGTILMIATCGECGHVAHSGRCMHCACHEPAPLNGAPIVMIRDLPAGSENTDG